VHILCTGGQTRIYNPATGSFVAGPTFAAIASSSAAVACGNNGLCVYGFGASGNANFRGYVALVSANKTVKTANIALPDQATGRVPVFAKSIGNKVYILTTGGSGVTSSINRFDTATERFDVGATPTTPFIEMGMEAFSIDAMTVTTDTIFVSVRRGFDGRDVLAYDAVTGARAPAKDISLPGGSFGLFNANGLSASVTTLYVGTNDGARAYNLSTMQPIVNGVYSASGNGAINQSVAYSQVTGSVYISQPFTNRINRFAAAVMTTPNGGFDKTVNTGRITFVE
jgi:hypothetical protein